MYPILFEFRDFKLPSWHVLYVLGAVSAYVYLIAIRRKILIDLDENRLTRLYAICYVAGYLGARLLSVFIEQQQVWQSDPKEIFFQLLTLGPMTFYGGLIAATLAGLVYSRLSNIRIPDVFDASMPAGLLALSIGRVGCFLNGDDYGVPVPFSSELNVPWWSVTFPNLQDGISRYPVQLIEASLTLIIVLIVTARFRYLREAFRPGAVGLTCLALYANIRFFLEFLRDDFRGVVFGTWLSTSQFISIMLLFCCALSLPYWLGKGTNVRDLSQ